ncbi:MAG: sugar phosphate isomerase/epimerase family protein [Thermodesulfobacteriota bacterium]
MTIIHVNVPYGMLLQRIQFAIDHRIHPEIYFSAEDLDCYEEKEASKLAGRLHQNGLEITLHGPFMDLSPGGVDPKVKEITRERFLKTIEIGSLFKPKTIVFHPGYERWKFNGDVSLWLNSSLETWRPLVKEAELRGLVLAIENVFEETPTPLLFLLEAIHSLHFRFCFDTGHQHLFSKTPFSDWIKTLKPYLVEIHLHDNHRERDEHLPLGEGTIDAEGFFHLLFFEKIHPIYTIEPHQEDHLWRGLKAAERFLSIDKF